MVQNKLKTTFKLTETEWRNCKEYFNNECAYCGRTEDENLEIYGKLLIREHVENYGKKRSQ